MCTKEQTPRTQVQSTIRINGMGIKRLNLKTSEMSTMRKNSCFKIKMLTRKSFGIEALA